jgi:ribose transport system substrate-binding protein
MAGDFVTFIGGDDEAMGRLAIDAIAAAMPAGGDVVLIEGPDTAPTSRDRGRGFRAGLAAHPRLRLLASAPGRYLRTPGRDAMATLLARHHHIDGVICTNDLMALGAIDALAAAGRTALVTGVNGTIDAAEAIGAGRMLATIAYDGFTMGAVAAMAALRHLAGQPVPPEILLPTPIIRRDNHRAWLLPAAQRPLPSWHDIIHDTRE